eukprot:2919012-Prymnesium_polylepis.1
MVRAKRTDELRTDDFFILDPLMSERESDQPTTAPRRAASALAELMFTMPEAVVVRKNSQRGARSYRKRPHEDDDDDDASAAAASGSEAACGTALVIADGVRAAGGGVMVVADGAGACAGGHLVAAADAAAASSTALVDGSSSLILAADAGAPSFVATPVATDGPTRKKKQRQKQRQKRGKRARSVEETQWESFRTSANTSLRAVVRARAI